MPETRLGGEQIRDGGITNADIDAAAAIDGSKLAAGSVTATEIASGAVAASIGAGEISGAMLATGAAAANIGTGELDGNVIANGTLTDSQLAAGAAVANIGAGGITTTELATGAVVGAIGSGEITAGMLAAGAAVANIGAGGISTTELAAGAVDLTTQISGLLPTGNLNVSQGALVVGASGDSGASLALAPGQIIVGDASGYAAAVAMSGAATIDSAGVVSITGANFADGDVPAGTVNGVNDTFVLSDTPVAGSEHVYVNGLRMKSTDDYTITDDTIVFITPPVSGNILVDYRY